MKALQEAIRAAGSQVALAKTLGITKSNISHWKRLGAVPATHALAIERLFGISAQKLAPARKIK
jgi:DNA-binding transcriptional regulator YdaS (Cro superfamily)